MQACCPRM